ncbi:DUF4157 domain-containing protein [Paenibacillus humicola]|uniref:eCIS core domain-containing protein n=1 Tax=Paenibacillus humicola TaxID=3110540 RepID=UPI00237C4CE5|nr:DUF4157 domain-containing protein [Paenibacillus humicola]
MMSKKPGQEPAKRISRSETNLETEARKAAANSPAGDRIRGGQKPFSAGALIQLQRSMGNRALGRWLGNGRPPAELTLQRKENRTGMPDVLKSGVERLSGMTMDDVKVHYNSVKPAGLQALAYAQGTDIYVGPGQEKHLPHEAWHVVQQRQGRVAPTTEVSGEAVNDERSLEEEADAMGARALQAGSGTVQRKADGTGEVAAEADSSAGIERPSRGSGIVQRRVVTGSGDEATIDDIAEYFDTNDLKQAISDRDLKRDLTKENKNDKRDLTIREFLDKIGAIGDSKSDSEDDSDDEWDPADYAADPMDPDDVLSSDVRKSLSFDSTAKGWMKTDTPKDASGSYVCHICRQKIKKGEKVDMDHLPPWKDRLHAFITEEQLTEDDTDELSGANMKKLYNMRGSVFAHSSCNRGHSGEQNYVKKWGSAENWYKAGGGAPF